MGASFIVFELNFCITELVSWLADGRRNADVSQYPYLTYVRLCRSAQLLQTTECETARFLPRLASARTVGLGELKCRITVARRCDPHHCRSRTPVGSSIP